MFLKDENDIMKGKIKPKQKEDEPEMPTLRKRSVVKDKVEMKYIHIKSISNLIYILSYSNDINYFRRMRKNLTRNQNPKRLKRMSLRLRNVLLLKIKRY